MKQIEKLYDETGKTYFVGDKKTFSVEDVINFAKKDQKVSANSLKLGFATQKKGCYLVDTEEGTHWCVSRIH